MPRKLHFTINKKQSILKTGLIKMDCYPADFSLGFIKKFNHFLPIILHYC